MDKNVQVFYSYLYVTVKLLGEQHTTCLYPAGPSNHGALALFLSDFQYLMNKIVFNSNCQLFVEVQNFGPNLTLLSMN